MTTLRSSRLVTALAVALLGSVIVLTPDSSFGQITSTRSNTFGGNGGASFDDSHNNIEAWGPIRQIVVRHGSEVDSIGVFWANGNFFNHGGTGGTETMINLDSDEFIKRVDGRSGDRLDQITFTSNKKAYGPYGGGGGSPFTVDFSGKALHYLFGRSGAEIDQIGFGYGDQPPALPTTIVRSDGHGGNGGNPFDDLNAAGNLLGKIKSITVRHGSQVDNLAVFYDGQSGNDAHGGKGGTEDTFTLDDNEWLTEIRGRSGDQLDQVQFFTSTGRASPQYGGFGGSPFTEKRDKSVIKAFFGRSGSLVDQLGVYFEDAKPTSIEITSVTYNIGLLNVVQQPPLAALTVLLENTTSTPQTVSQTKTVETTDTTTTTFSETTEVSVEVKTTANFIFTSGEWTLGLKQGFTYSTGSSHADQNTYSVQFQATVPANSTIKGTAIVNQGNYNVPYTATANVTYQDRPPATVTLHGILYGVATASVIAEYEPVVTRDFTLTPQAPTSVTVNAGQPASYTIAVGAQNGFTGSVNLTCSLPAASTTCTVSPASLTPPGNVTVNITTARAAVPPAGPWRLRPRPLFVPLVVLVAALLILLTKVKARRVRLVPSLPLAVVLLLLVMQTAGCRTPAGTYSVTITGTSGATSHTTTVTLVVN